MEKEKFDEIREVFYTACEQHAYQLLIIYFNYLTDEIEAGNMTIGQLYSYLIKQRDDFILELNHKYCNKEKMLIKLIRLIRRRNKNVYKI